MLAIVLIPTIVLMALGIGGSAYLVYQGRTVQRWAGILELLGNAPRDFTSQVAEERRLSMMWLAGDDTVEGDLAKQRELVSRTFEENNSKAEEFTELNPEANKSSREAALKVISAFEQMRTGIDERKVPGATVYAFYNSLNDAMIVFLDGVAKHAPDPSTAANESLAANLIDLTDSMSKSNALGVYGIGNGLSQEDYREFVDRVGYYHAGLKGMAPRLATAEQAQYKKLVSSESWAQMIAMENAIIQRGAGTSAQDAPPLPMSVAEWQSAATQVNSGLFDLYQAQYEIGLKHAIDSGNRTFTSSLLAGIGVLLVAIIAAVVAARLSNQLVKRLKRLRAETLELADERLPGMVQRLRAGEQIDIASEVPSLDYGRDELGQVAEAFNKAQRTAVAAAAQEAEIQSGVKAVFLNIAHRSQVVVRRQLEVLDKVEREQEDPEQLESLFQLDHLATRARRNAENLIILGGEQPGRQWRNPVPLVDIARSAIGETEHYRRVNTSRLPDRAVVGSAVADLIHLLAELIDNATAFSPPDSRVEVRGNNVGKGIVIEVEDQGLGIPEDVRENINAFLQNPPDFGIMSLSEEARLGLFVVSQLAMRHGISVTLVDSAYGGIRAIVLVRSALLAPWESSGPTRSISGSSMPGATSEPEPHGAIPAIQQYSTTGPVIPTQGRDAWPNDLETPDFPANPNLAEPPPVSWPGRGAGNGVSAPQPPTNGDGYVPETTSPLANGAQNPGDGRPPPLPRRRRQANISPQLAQDPERSESIRPEDTNPTDSAERARSRMSAFQRGTREGRSSNT